MGMPEQIENLEEGPTGLEEVELDRLVNEISRRSLGVMIGVELPLPTGRGSFTRTYRVGSYGVMRGLLHILERRLDEDEAGGED